MIKCTYTYSFKELSGKPKRFIENQPDCTLKGYGVSSDTVTFCVLYENKNCFNRVNNMLLNKFNLIPNNIKMV